MPDVMFGVNVPSSAAEDADPSAMPASLRIGFDFVCSGRPPWRR
jgi:hypothetical protein